MGKWKQKGRVLQWWVVQATIFISRKGGVVSKTHTRFTGAMCSPGQQGLLSEQNCLYPSQNVLVFS